MATGTAHERVDSDPYAFPYVRPPLTRRTFLSLMTLASGALIVPSAVVAGLAGRHTLKQESQRPCAETMQHILDVAATLEALAVTFY